MGEVVDFVFEAVELEYPRVHPYFGLVGCYGLEFNAIGDRAKRCFPIVGI